MASSAGFGLYEPASGEQAACARVVTDRPLFAWLAHGYVGSSVRCKGVGPAFVGRVREHLEPYGPRRILLATQDAHARCERPGFRPPDRPEQRRAHPLE
ncbi:hypothetical protein ABZ079_11510 [Streptomyces sp. NPDC006314]|uniref:hypothetical protein n=1 Tax=Streptomyces sp. NPDC006314 TaxID=3154475 RepID=UPI0033B54DE9